MRESDAGRPFATTVETDGAYKRSGLHGLCVYAITAEEPIYIRAAAELPVSSASNTF